MTSKTEGEDFIPRLVRPRRSLIIAAASFLAHDQYLGMSLEELIGKTMEYAHGQQNPEDVKLLWESLLREAGK